MEKFQWFRLFWFPLLMQFLSWYITRTVIAEDVNKIVHLNISEEYIDVKVNDSLYIKCTGPPRLDWDFRDPLRTDLISIDDIKESVTHNSFKNESIIHLIFKSEENTGRYTCGNDEQESSLYVFVNGNQLLLFNLYTLVRTGKPNFIPCFPTISDAKVSLWKIAGTNKREVPLSFDHMRGFIVEVVPENMTGEFECIAEHGNATQMELIFVEKMDAISSVPEIYINDTNATNVTVGSDFSLECVIRTEVGAHYEQVWEYPTIRDESRRNQTMTYMSTGMQNIGKFILKIYNVTKEDEGNYRCSARDVSGNSHSAEVLVTVH